MIGKSVRKLLYFGVCGMYCLALIVMLVDIPLCWASSRLGSLLETPEGPHLSSYLYRLLYWLMVDRSAITSICIAVFFGTLLSYLEHRRRIERLQDVLEGKDTASNPGVNDPALKALNSHVEAGKDFRDGCIAFEGQLARDTDLFPYEVYLVTLGLLGTLASFYIGFAERLQDLSLGSVSGQLLRVVGTACVSSIAGIGLGMIFVRAMAIDLKDRVGSLAERVLNTPTVFSKRS